jgi:hypothetical protein
MAKFKPKEFNSFIPRKPEEWALWGLYYAGRFCERAFDGTRRFKCGNPLCGKETALNEQVAWIPPRCMYCGDEFDWEGLLTEKKKICPDCETEYPKYANFCVFHPTQKIALQEIEYRK